MSKYPDILFLVIFATIINFLDLSALAYTIPILEEEFSLGEFQIGLIASGLGIGYFLAIGFAGYLVDRFGPVKVWGVSTFLWAIVIMATSLASDFFSLFVCRLLLGAAESAHFPSLVRTIADWLPAESRGRSIALSLIGVPFSFVIGGPFLSSLIRIYTWQGMYLVLGFFSLLWAFFWIFTFFRKRNIHLRTMPPQSTISDASLLRIFLRSPTCLSLCALNLCFAYLLFFSLTWFPYYLEKTYRIFIGDAGFLTAIPWLVATLFLLAGGWMTDAIQKKTESLRAARSYQSILGFFLAAVCFFLMSYSADFVLNLSLFSLALGFIFLFQTPLFIVNVDLFPRHCSFSLGITIIFASVGIVFSPLVTSKALERTGDFHLALLIAAAVSLASALIAYFFLHPKKSLEHIRQ